jgi:hypothetical protein
MELVVQNLFEGLQSPIDHHDAGQEPFSGTFKSFEGEEKAHSPGNVEELQVFKQRTLSTSRFIVNLSCSGSLVIDKKDFDRLQVLMNDLSLWKPRASAADHHVIALPSSLNLDCDRSFSSDGDNDVSPSDDTIRMQLESTHLEHGQSAQATIHDPTRGGAQFTSTGTPHMELTLLSVSANLNSLSLSIGATSFKYDAELSDAEVFAAFIHDGKPGLNYICMQLRQLNLRNATVGKPLLKPTISGTGPHDQDDSYKKPMLMVTTMITSDDALNVREVTLTINFAYCSLDYDGLVYVGDIVDFFGEPPGIVYPEYDNRFTKLFVNFNTLSILWFPIQVRSMTVLLIKDAWISSNIIPDSPTTGVKIVLNNSRLFTHEPWEVTKGDTYPWFEIRELVRSDEALSQFYSAHGLALVGKSDFVEVFLRRNTAESELYPLFDLEISNHSCLLDVCADSMQTFSSFLQNFSSSESDAPETAKSGASSPATSEVSKLKSVHENAAVDDDDDSDRSLYEDVLEGVDENAFKYSKKSEQLAASEALGQADKGIAESDSPLEICEEYYNESSSKVLNMSDEELDDTGKWDKIKADGPGRPLAKEAHSAGSVQGPSEAVEDQVKVLDPEATELAFVEDYFMGTRHYSSARKSSKG